MVNFTLLTYNRAKLTAQCLNSLGDKSDMTITIRDDSTEEETADLVYNWAFENNAHAFTMLDEYGTGFARNQVINYSEKYFGRGDFLYISDNDVWFVRPDWLNILIDAYWAAYEYGFRVIGAYNHPYNGPIPNQQRVYLGKDRNTDVIKDVYSVYAVASQSMLMSWDTFDEFGPFCETPVGKVCQSEDVDLCNRIRAAGFEVGVINPHLLVNTGITNSFGEKIPGWELVKSHCPSGVLCE